MERKIFSIVCLLSFLLIGEKLSAQQVNNLYFLDNVPVQHHLNPAFQPTSTFYIGIPLLNRFGVDTHTDFPGFRQAGFRAGQSFDFEVDKTQFLKSLSPLTNFDLSAGIGIIDFGFRYNSNFFTLTVSEKINSTSRLPYGLFDLMLNQSELTNGVSTNMALLSLQQQTYTELALGFSHRRSENFGFGTKVKILSGTSYLDMNTSKALLNIADDRVDAHLAMNIQSTGLLQIDEQLKMSAAPKFTDYLIPSGMGGALDVGAYYKPVSFVKLALAVTDLGLIRWNKMKNTDYALDYTMDATDWASWVMSHPGATTIPSDTIWADMQRALTSTSSDSNGRLLYLQPRMNGSVEVGMLNNKISLGVLYAARAGKNSWRDEITSAVTLRPADWVNLSLSYSLREGRESNFGLGAGFKAKKVNFYFAADYLPFRTVKLNLQQFDEAIPSINLPLAYDRGRMNFVAGINIVMGKWLDKDKDGVSDAHDRCLDTPTGVKVDAKGCPKDSDKDGVPDYLDKCPNTKKEARNHVDIYGCPLDTDGDGVLDYADKCPDNSPEAKGFVDATGCPTDADKDGVYDYRDKCADTPQGIEVDENGCPLDTDGDGIPDYLDLCPNTPSAALGFVDKNGCPTDKDDDGVLDYLDLCPNTPIEARGYVDSNGCLYDKDDDGVPDYLDECPETAFEARGTVDHRGCPKDSDFDGVPDYIDDCPRIPGVASNRGCPEVKTEIHSLLKSALLGIQFDSDSMRITSRSYPMLDQLAEMLNENASYKLLIQGHSDNQVRRLPGTASDSTQTAEQQKMNVSEYYSVLVKNYLIDKGISSQRLFVKGFGDTKPVSTNSTSEGRARNRRVELSIVFEELK